MISLSCFKLPLWCLVLAAVSTGICAQSPECELTNGELRDHMARGHVFLGGVAISALNEKSGNHELVVSWKLSLPDCMERVCVQFSPGRHDENCMDSTRYDEVRIKGLPCNKHVNVHVRASAAGISRTVFGGRVYIGGDPSLHPSVSPSRVFARPVHREPQRIVMGWEPLRCLQQNSDITGYFVEYGKTDTLEVRNVTTRERYIYSEMFETGEGLGFLQFGEEYWFRVAAMNVRGRGPFSPAVTATPMDLLQETSSTNSEMSASSSMSTESPPTTTSHQTHVSTDPPSTKAPATTPALKTSTKAPERTVNIPPELTTEKDTTEKPSPKSVPGFAVNNQPLSLSISSQDTTSAPSNDVETGTEDKTTLPSNATTKALTKKAEANNLEGVEAQTIMSNSDVTVTVIVVVFAIVLTVAIPLVAWILWRHRAVWKKQKRVGSMEALNNHGFMIFNRNSQIFDYSRGNAIEENIYDEIRPIEPRLKEYAKTITVREGEEVNLRISFTGIPRPTVMWFFNGNRLSVESNDGREHCNNGCIYIASAEGKHAGIYDFVVSNSAGSVEGCTRLDVSIEERRPSEERKTLAVVESNPITKERFGEHVLAYHALNNADFIEEYQSLPNKEEGKLALTGRTMGNRIRNRFRNIMCYDDNRVVLTAIPGHMNCHHDYINASYIDGYLQPKRYIAVQAPLQVTIMDFWRLVWQEKVQNIVMLTNLMEGRQRKCELYWPTSGSKEYGPFMVTLIEEQVFADYVVRTMHVLRDRPGQGINLRRVTQFHFTGWPDHGVPEYAGPLLQFLRRIKALHEPENGPLLVHCSAGVGRTGTLIGIDIALAQATKEGVVDMPAIVTKMRAQRMKMVQSPDQYAFIHDAVLEWLTCGDTKIPAGELQQSMETLSKKDGETGESGYDTQFKVLQQMSPNQKHIERVTALKCPEKNRNSNFLPPDKWRVILKAETIAIETTYIHASFVNAYKQKRGLIVAQAPMRGTTEDFWKMVYERECSVIVMLSDLKEKGKELCHQYWPTVNSSTRIDGVKHGDYFVFTLDTKRQDGCMIRTFGVADHKNAHMRRVTQFQMTNWSDAGLCEDPSSVMKIIDEISLIQRRTGNKPIVIHGCDTISRCGVFCALLNCIECCKTESSVDVFQVVKAIRIQKPGMIQTVEQYQFIHDLMLMFLNSFSKYSNFK